MHPTSLHSQRGITLLESLVAIVVTALGILGILGVQMRTLIDSQNSVYRAQAIRLIDDLTERTAVNPNALRNLSAYAIPLATATGSPPLTPRAGTLCDSVACTPDQLASYDAREWKRTVETVLPRGDAQIFVADGETSIGNQRQLGVMVVWRENERARPGISAADIAAEDAAVNTADSGSGGGGVQSCPAGYSCHLQYISVAARCAPYLKGIAAQYFCPGPQL